MTCSCWDYLRRPFLLTIIDYDYFFNFLFLFNILEHLSHEILVCFSYEAKASKIWHDHKYSNFTCCFNFLFIHILGFHLAHKCFPYMTNITRKTLVKLKIMIIFVNLHMFNRSFSFILNFRIFNHVMNSSLHISLMFLIN